MSCKGNWEQTANELESAARVSAGQVDGALRCDHDGCDRLVVRNKNTCLAGHVQGARQQPAGVVALPAELNEALRCAAEEYRRGALGGEWEEDPRVRAAAAYVELARRGEAGYAWSNALADYVARRSPSSAKSKADIAERWASRVVANGWDGQGEAGAAAYLERFGRGISADKCVLLARYAESMGCPDVARGFWKRAYELETGQPTPLETLAPPRVTASLQPPAAPPPKAAPLTEPASGGDALSDYIASKTKKPYKPVAAMVERWQTRVVPNRWQEHGEAGARAYLGAYGKGIGTDKCVLLARHAEAMGYPDMARGFWKRAYELEKGKPAPAGGAMPQPVAGPAAAGSVQSPPARTTPTISGLPDALQPGNLVAMKPVDAPEDREFYINAEGWWGQPKRDGERRTVHVGPGQVCYQAGSLSIRELPSPAIDRALAEVAQERGPFVLDGEVYYLDAEGGEHRSAAQAVAANLTSGHAGEMPRIRYAIFKALHAEGQDLTGRPESERIAAGESLGRALTALTDEIEVLPTARTAAEKRALVARQQAEGREGEVWVRSDCTYTGGKTPPKRAPFVRTKYISTADVVIMGLTKSTDAGRPFGAIQVGQYVDGKLRPIGSIGTGYTREEMAEIAAAHAANPGRVVIEVGSQGMTEGGKLWQGRYHGLRTDKPPEECVR